MSSGSVASADGARLREALEVGASPAELEAFIARNRVHLTSATEAALRRFTPQEQRHIMRRGDLPPDVCEPVLCKRLKESREMARKLTSIVAAQGRTRREESAPKGEAPTMFLPGFDMQNVVSMCEVHATESRFASAVGSSASAGAAPALSAGGLQEGSVCGVGGVIEVTKKKFGCDPGTRLRVLGEKGNLWQCDGGIAIVKFQREGWQWILSAEAQEAQRLNQEAAQKQRRSGRDEQKGQDESERRACSTEGSAWQLRAIRVLQERERVAARTYDEELERQEQQAQQRKEDEETRQQAAAEAAKKMRKRAAEKAKQEKEAKPKKEKKAGKEGKGAKGGKAAKEKKEAKIVKAEKLKKKKNKAEAATKATKTKKAVKQADKAEKGKLAKEKKAKKKNEAKAKASKKENEKKARGKKEKEKAKQAKAKKVKKKVVKSSSSSSTSEKSKKE